MLIQKSIKNSKVKSFTANGEKAITRAYFYKEKDKDYIGISFSVIYLSDSDKENDEYVRSIGDKFVYKREYTLKRSTLMDTLINLGIIEGELENKR